MALSRPTIVLFDMDGTTVRHINPRLLTALEKLDDIAYAISRFWSRVTRQPKSSPVDLKAEYHGSRPRLLVHRAMHKIRRKPVEKIVEPCPGVLSILQLLKENSIPTAIVSNGLGKGYGHDILKQFDLERYFDVRIFRESINQSKPHPDPLLKALQKLGHQVSEEDVIWYIGDRHKDIKAALALREHVPAKIEPLSYGLQAAIAVLEYNVGPDHIITSYHDFLPRLQAMFTTSGADRN